MSNLSPQPATAIEQSLKAPQGLEPAPDMADMEESQEAGKSKLKVSGTWITMASYEVLQ